MDVTTLALAVDSTQVNTAATALDKFAVSGTKAEGAATRLSKATADQGKSLLPLAKGADKAALSFKTLEEAQAALGGKGANRLAAAAAELGLTQSKADAAAASMRRLGEEAQTAGAKTQAALSGTAVGGVGAPKPGTPTQAATAAAPVVGAATANAARAIVKGNEDIAKSAKLAAFQQQQLGFQIHDFAVQVVSGQSPLTAFVQQGSQLSGTFGGAGNAFRAVTALITPLRLAIGGVVGVLGAVGYAFLEGAKQSRAFADAIQVSGNYAGQTEGKFNALARSVAASSESTVSNVREIGNALLRTGEIGPQVFAQATAAAVGYGEATGKTAQEVAKDFAAMARAPTKFAAEANRSLNFLTAAQYESIKAFEEAGRAADAQGVILDALNQRFPKVSQNLGTLERILHGTKGAWAAFWDAAFDIGRSQTIEDKIANTADKINNARAQLAAPGVSGADVNAFSGRPTTGKAGVAALEAQQSENFRKQFRQTENAAGEAIRAEAQKAAIAADTVIDGYLKRGKAASTYKQKLDELNRGFRDKEAAGVPVSKADQAVALNQLKKDFAGPKGSSSGKGEAEQILRANLQQDLKGIKDAFNDERDAIAFQQRYLQGVYQAGQLSLKDFYDEKRQTIANGVDAEIAELDKEIARLKEYQKATKDPSNKITAQTEINELEEQKKKVRITASREVVTANIEQETTYRQLNEQVLTYRANLLQLQGDEIGSAKVRAQIAEQQLSVLAKQSQGSSNPITAGDQAAAKRATDQQIALSEARLKSSGVNELLQQSEERISLAQRTGSIGEIQALQQLGSVRAQAVAELEKIVAAQEEVAKSRPQDYQLQIDTSRARLELDKLKADLDPLKEKFDNLFKDAGANFFQDLMSGKPKDALKNFGATISRELSSIASKELSQQVFGKGGILGGLGGKFADMVGGKDRNKPTIDTSGVQQSFTSLQASGIDPTISAFSRLIASIDSAGNSLGTNGIPKPSGDTTTLPTGDFARLDRGQTTGEDSVMDLFRDAGKANENYAATSAQSAAQVLQLANAASKGGSALGLLPSIISMIQAAASTSSGSGGDLFGSFAKLFGGSSGGSTYESLNSGIYGSMVGFNHSGGIVGKSTDIRPVDPSIFTGATRHHSGGVVGQAAKAIPLKTNEVPAVLLRNEEVLTERDPRHSKNLTPEMKSAFATAAPKYHTGGTVGKAADRALPMLSVVNGAAGGKGGAGGSAISSALAAGGAGGRGGDGADMRKLATNNVFADAPRYHEGGVVAGVAKAANLKPNEVPAVLMGGPKGVREEVLHASDPRHRDNMTPQVAMLFKDITRYHTGGIVGRKADDRIPALLKAQQRQYLTAEKDGKTEAETAAPAGDTHNHFHYTIGPGTTQQHAVNMSRVMARDVERNLGNRARTR